MFLKESYKKRIQKLAGLNENVSLTAESGRSDDNTLSWYIEEYLLKLGGDLLNQLDEMAKDQPSLILSVSRSSTKIMANSLVIKLMLEGEMGKLQMDEEFLITLSVNIETDSNTIVSINYKGIINKVNLSSKHSKNDLSRFRSEIVESVFNSLNLTLKK